MYNKVLLATDGSSNSMEAAKIANSWLEKGLVKEIAILNVAPFITSGYYDLTGDLYQAVQEQTKEAGEEILKNTKELFLNQDKVKTFFEFGSPIAEKICRFAAEGGYELIIIGSRGMNPVSGLLLGSVSARVLHHSQCPVLIVKPA